jgi:hypothetical protein
MFQSIGVRDKDGMSLPYWQPRPPLAIPSRVTKKCFDGRNHRRSNMFRCHTVFLSGRKCSGTLQLRDVDRIDVPGESRK